jgi:hypothetical protein
METGKSPKNILGAGGKVFLGSGQGPWSLQGHLKFKCSKIYS